MTVIVKYVVERNGKEVMTFTTKKEADAYDKQLDIAEELFALMQESQLEIQDKVLDDLAFFLAQHKERAISVLKGGKSKPVPVPDSAPVPKADKPVRGVKNNKAKAA